MYQVNTILILKEFPEEIPQQPRGLFRVSKISDQGRAEKTIKRRRECFIY